MWRWRVEKVLAVLSLASHRLVINCYIQALLWWLFCIFRSVFNSCIGDSESLYLPQFHYGCCCHHPHGFDQGQLSMSSSPTMFLQGSITATRAWDITISQVICPGELIWYLYLNICICVFRKHMSDLQIVCSVLCPLKCTVGKPKASDKSLLFNWKLCFLCFQENFS